MSNRSLTLVAAGDIYITRAEPESAFVHFGNLIREADVAFCNLEGPCSNGGEATIGKYITLRMRPAVVPALARVGFDIAALANNHALDYGREAFVETLDHLHEAGILSVGGGRDLEEATRPAVLERNGIRLGLLAYATTVPWGYEAAEQQAGIAPIRVRTLYEPRYQIMGEQPGTPATVITEINPDDLAALVEEVQRLKSETDVVIVSLHWGVAFVPDPVDYQREMAHAVIDAGADMVLGHHAHVIQGVEMYRGAPIFYSLSNFVFDRNNPKFGLETFLVLAEFGEERLTRVALRPAILPLNGDPRPLREGERDLFKAQMERLSTGMNVRLTWHGDDLEITTATS